MSGLLRICTAGGVDDGKSTLIGKMLHDAQAVYEDQVHSVRAASTNRGAGPIDFSLFTDGLKAEREQGVKPQSRRHARIAQLLGITDFVVAVNKMDLVDFNREVYERIRGEFADILGGARCHTIPLSALLGDNVMGPSPNTPWFEGPGLLEHLETVDVAHDLTAQPFRFPVQLVMRPDHLFRGYAGQIVTGVVRVGDLVTAWPSDRSARVKRIVTHDGDLEMAFAPMSVTISLDEEIDISRGDQLSGTSSPPHVGNRFQAEIVWMDERPAQPGRVYLLKHTTRTVAAEVDRTLALNQIGTATVSVTRPLVFDRYESNRATGSFVLIDPATCFPAFRPSASCSRTC